MATVITTLADLSWSVIVIASLPAAALCEVGDGRYPCAR
jgi:hypothetical protein